MRAAGESIMVSLSIENITYSGSLPVLNDHQLTILVISPDSTSLLSRMLSTYIQYVATTGYHWMSVSVVQQCP